MVKINKLLIYTSHAVKWKAFMLSFFINQNRWQVTVCYSLSVSLPFYNLSFISHFGINESKVTLTPRYVIEETMKIIFPEKISNCLWNCVELGVEWFNSFDLFSFLFSLLFVTNVLICFHFVSLFWIAKEDIFVRPLQNFQV